MRNDLGVFHRQRPWIFRATFVLQRKTNVWALGWTLENCGIIEGGEPSEFLARTVKVGRDIDVPVLIAMFTEMSRQETST